MKPTDFSVHVTTFLTHYLAAQRNVSPNTIKAYRDVFTLLLRFCRECRIAPKDCASNRSTFLWWKRSGLLGEGALRPLHETIALRPCTLSSDMFSRKNRTACFSAKKSSPFPSADTPVLRLGIFPKRTWLKFWRSRT
jgi:hypothetical protein